MGLYDGFVDEMSKLGVTFRRLGITAPGERKHLADALRKFNKYIGPSPRGRLEAFKKDVAGAAKADASTPIKAHDIAHATREQ